MQATHQNLFMRDDTFFGVCEAIAEDFRIPGNLLRVALALTFFWNPVVVVGGYLAAGILIAVVRFIAPNPRPSPRPAAAAEILAEPAEPSAAEPANCEQLAQAA
jgi:phage shock protein PspC (stress-responsive transcriptional regulator)